MTYEELRREHDLMKTALELIHRIERDDHKHPRPVKTLDVIGQIVRSVLANLADEEEAE